MSEEKKGGCQRAVGCRQPSRKRERAAPLRGALTLEQFQQRRVQPAVGGDGIPAEEVVRATLAARHPAAGLFDKEGTSSRVPGV